MMDIPKTSASLKSLKGYGIPQTVNRAEDQWCESVAASIVDVRLKRREEEEQEVALLKEKARRADEEDGEEDGSRQTLALNRLNCDFVDLGEDLTDPTEGSFSSGKHKILRVGYYNRGSDRKWRNTTRIKRPDVASVTKYRPTRRHKHVPMIKVDAPVDEALAVTASKPPGFRKSKLPPMYKEIKSVMQPSLPTIDGNGDKFKSIDRQIEVAREIWRQEEEERRRAEERAAAAAEGVKG